jgi:hypothetical protein
MHVDLPAPSSDPKRISDAIQTLVDVSEPGIIVPGPVVTCPVPELRVGSPLLLGAGYALPLVVALIAQCAIAHEAMQTRPDGPRRYIVGGEEPTFPDGVKVLGARVRPQSFPFREL